MVNNQKRPVVLSGLKTLTASQVTILSNRTSQFNVIFRGIQHLEPELWSIVAPLEHLVFDYWLTQTPEYLEHHCERNPKGSQPLNLRNVPIQLFTQLDLSEITRMDLRYLPVMTSEHLGHLSQFEFEILEIPSYLLNSNLIQNLQQWSYPNTVLRIVVHDTPLEQLKGIEQIPVRKIEIDNITVSNPDLEFLFAGNVQNLELEVKLPLKGIEQFTGDSLTLHSVGLGIQGIPTGQYRDSYNPDEANELITAFNGKNLNIDSIFELNTALTKTIMTRQFNLRIWTEDIFEDDEEEVYKILKNSELRNLNYTLYIEDLGICGIDEYAHINESEFCEILREQYETNQYWENHDCGEHDTGEH